MNFHVVQWLAVIVTASDIPVLHILSHPSGS